ncbi:MAG TPA: hypothetical protein VIZ18_17915 [Ktedonobacteraceae bacterium]
MISTMTQDTQKTFEELFITSERALPTTPFPRKYIHSAFNDRKDALQAAQSLHSAGYDTRDIYMLTYADYSEAMNRGQTLFSSLTSTDLDAYLDEARHGRTILAVRLANYGQIEQVRDLLAPHRAHLVRYIDTWTMAQLLP